MRSKFFPSVLLILLFTGAFGSTVQAASLKMMKYRNAEHGIALTYPKGWLVEGPKLEKEAIIFTFKPSNGGVQVDLIISDLKDKPISLDEFVDEILKSFGMGDSGAENAPVVKKRSKAKLSKMSAVRILISMIFKDESAGDIEVTREQIHALRGEKGYIVILTSPKNTYSKNSKVFKKMLKAFKVF